MALTLLSDLVEPEVFLRHLLLMTEKKNAIIASGAMVRDPMLDQLLAGPGRKFHLPAYFDLDPSAAERTGTETTADLTAGATSVLTSEHEGIQSAEDQAVRFNRNQSWSATTLARLIVGINESDPMNAIVAKASEYWAARIQAMVIAMVQGISADNAANDLSGGVGDYAFDVAGASFTDGVTNFTAEAQIDAKQTMGDSGQDLALMIVHSVVGSRMEKADLIDFIPDSFGRRVGQYRNMLVIEDDDMPNGANAIRGDGAAGAAGIYETWMFGPGALTWGSLPPPRAVSVEWDEKGGNGSGEEILWNRQQLSLHMPGHEYTATPALGGPSNVDLANGANWNRAAVSNQTQLERRKKIKFTRLVTREA